MCNQSNGQVRTININDRYSISGCKDKKNILLMTILIIITSFLIYFLKNNDLVNGIKCFLVVEILIYVLLGIEFFIKQGNGYRVIDTGIEYRQCFKQKKICYETIPCIIFSVAYGKSNSYGYIGKRKGISSVINYPWITLTNGKPKVFLEKWDIELNGNVIDIKIKKEKKYIYSFVWNDDALLNNLFERFRGEYYITNSLFTRYCIEIEKTMEKYKVDKNRIHIIQDCGEYKDFYREINYDVVNEVKEKILQR